MSHRDGTANRDANGDRWPVIKQFVARALQQAPQSREAWLDGQDMSDEVRQGAKALLQAHLRAQDFLARAALESPAAAADALAHEAPAVVVPAVQVGATIGAYRTIRLIAEGRTGTVFLATRADSAFDTHVAIRLVRQAPSNPGLAERPPEEWRLLAALDHPGIARLLDAGVTSEGRPFVVTEYVDGVPIDFYCRTRQLPLTARLHLVQQLCEAVQVAHRNLVVHRDIKASNVLVSPAGAPKLIDFGFAHALGNVVTSVTASPEQVRGEAVTVATDVWALGGLLYALIAGRPPFAYAASAAALTRAICEEEPPSPGKLAPALGVPRDVELIVRKALARSPHDRYDSAAALGADIGRFLEGRPVAAAPESLLYRSRKFVWRHRAGTAAAAIGVTLVAGGIAATVWQARNADRQRAIAERRVEEMRQLANTTIFDLHDAIARLPGSAPARKLLVDRALRHLDGLSSDVGDDNRLRRDLAGAYERLAEVQGGKGHDTLGDASGARSSLDKAVTLRQQTADALGAAPRDQIALAMAYHQRASIDAAPVERLRLIDAGLSVLDRLAPSDQTRDEALLARATLRSSAAAVHAGAGEHADAASLYQGALDDFEHLVRIATPAKAASASWNLSRACKDFGALLGEMGAHANAVTLYQRAIALDEARLATQPDNSTWRLDLASGLAALASIELDTGEASAAVAHYEEALALRKAAYAAAPEDAHAKIAVERGEQAVARARAAVRDAVAVTDKR